MPVVSKLDSAGLGYTRIMKKKMETIGIIGYIGLYRDYIGIMTKKMETTIVYIGYIGVI